MWRFGVLFQKKETLKQSARSVPIFKTDPAKQG